jgi:hypothetical protein
MNGKTWETLVNYFLVAVVAGTGTALLIGNGRMRPGGRSVREIGTKGATRQATPAVPAPPARLPAKPGSLHFVGVPAELARTVSARDRRGGSKDSAGATEAGYGNSNAGYSMPRTSGGGSSSGSGKTASYQTSGGAEGSDVQVPSPRGTRKGLAGLFDGDGALDWPLGLRILPPAEETAALRQEVETFLRAALKGLGSGNAPASALKEARRDIARLQGLLHRYADRLPGSRHTVREARRYLRRLELFAKGLK